MSLDALFVIIAFVLGSVGGAWVARLWISLRKIDESVQRMLTFDGLSDDLSSAEARASRKNLRRDRAGRYAAAG